MGKIPTNFWTPKFHTFPTDRLSLHKAIADQQFDINYADRCSVGNADFLPTNVGRESSAVV
jgi:hypothetical protein